MILQTKLLYYFKYSHRKRRGGALGIQRNAVSFASPDTNEDSKLWDRQNRD